MRIDILTLFPEMFSPLEYSVIGRARQRGILQINIVDIRDFSADKHKKCDDYPFGGGAGMVMMPQPVHDCVNAVEHCRVRTDVFFDTVSRNFNRKFCLFVARIDCRFEITHIRAQFAYTLHTAFFVEVLHEIFGRKVKF